jgi:hypothetical protein
MSNLEFSGFGGPSKAIESSEVIGLLENGSSYRDGSPHSDLLRDAKAAIRGIKLYIREHCRPKMEKRHSKGMSPQNSKELGSRVSNDQ